MGKIDRMTNFIGELNCETYADPNGNVFDEIWKKYEKVILQSLVTSFGLDSLIHDVYGGDVDTVHNVREIGKDPNMRYKNANNQLEYENRTPYDNAAYHKDQRYREIVKKAKTEFNNNGTMVTDAYVTDNELIPKGNKTIPRGKQAQLDHVVSANEVHDDPGRTLAGIDGMDLANSPDNLRFTNAALNRNMSNMSVDEYIKWCEDHPDQVNYNGKKGEPLPEDVKRKLRTEYSRSKKTMDTQINKTYYTSPAFLQDTAKAAANVGVRMGERQLIGFVFVEIWISSENELQSIPPGSDLGEMLRSVAYGIKKGIENAQKKYKEMFTKFAEGSIAGMLSSLTTTLCNIFTTTAKNLARNIRQIYASVVQAGKVLLFNPDNLMFGDRIKTTLTILATGASVLVGTAVEEMIAKTPIGAIRGVGEYVRTFSAVLVSGLLSCTLLVFMDRSKFMNDIFNVLNKIPSEANDFKKIADLFEQIAADLSNIDIEQFKKDTEQYSLIAIKIEKTKDENELNDLLRSAYKTFGIQIPWEGDFDTFMGNKENRLVFE